MEGLTKEYGSSILITESTYLEVKDSIPCRIIDMVRVVGKKNGVRIYEPLDQLKGDATNEIASLSEEGFDNYLKRNWAAAIERYSRILSIKPDDKTSQIFIGRCESYKATEPPVDWDGVYTMLKK